jgi:hypothetical protein
MDKLLKRMNRRGATVSVFNRAHAHQKMINVREATPVYFPYRCDAFTRQKSFLVKE